MTRLDATGIAATSTLLRTSVLALCVAACSRSPGGAERGASAPGRATGTVAVILADSVPFENEMSSGHLRRVVVRAGEHADTLPGILVAKAPVVGPDEVVYGIRADGDLAEGLFAYDSRSRQVRSLPTPADWWEPTAPAIAPDGRHVAYLARTGEADGYGAVTALPSGRIVYRGPTVTMLETDAGVDAIHWTDAVHFDIRIALSSAVGGTQRIRGDVERATARVDTLRTSVP